MQANDSHTQGSRAKMQRGYTKHGKHDQISTQQTLSMMKYDQKHHEVKLEHASMEV